MTKRPSKIDKQKLLELRDEDELEFKQIATHFDCSKQAVHQAYYKQKVMGLLPILVIDENNNGFTYKVETMQDVKEELKNQGVTLVEFVNEVMVNRYLKV